MYVNTYIMIVKISKQVPEDNLMLSKLIEQMPGFVFLKNPAGLYTACSTAFLELVLCSHKNEILGKSDLDLPWKDMARTMQIHEQEVVRSKLEQCFIEQFVVGVGRLLTLEINKKPFFDSTNQLIGVISNVVVITRHDDQILSKNSTLDSLASETLAQQVAEVTGHLPDLNQPLTYYTEYMRCYLENIINTMPGNVYWMNTNSVFLGCNKNVLDLMGLSRNDYIGKTYDDLIKMGIWNAEQVKSFREDDLQVVQTGQPIYNKEEPPLPSPEGGLVYYLTSRVPIKNNEQRVVGIVGISTDITERKNMEEDLRLSKEAAELAKEKVEKINFMMTEFISNMGHDLATPITDVATIAMMLDEYTAEYPELKDTIQMLTERATACEAVRKRILNATSLSNLDVKFETFSVINVLLELEKEFRSEIDAKKLKLVIHPLKPKKEDVITTDREKFIAILDDLLSNAIHFTDEGTITISVTKENDIIHIKINDTGIGIPAEKFDYIFEPYTKLASSNQFGQTFKGPGCGLYLVIVRANILGATIRVESEVGKGSTFTLSIPVHPKK